MKQIKLLLSSTFALFALLSLGQAAEAKIDCRLVRCAAPTCKPGYIKVGQVKKGCCYVAKCRKIVKKCRYQGRTYSNGASFRVKCNTCRCLNGKVACTKKLCRPKGCLYKGRRYPHGSTFRVKCNTCRCLHGKVACTKKLCR
ncbi:MAG: hypothetical protein H6727_08910 [Myxococcales bacterium]|nr:hypothetical protein [Myxococcales bacterium]